MSQEPETAGSHESRSGTIIAVISGFTFLIVLTAALRLLAKAIARSKYTVDDLFVLITTVGVPDPIRLGPSDRFRYSIWYLMPVISRRAFQGSESMDGASTLKTKSMLLSMGSSPSVWQASRTGRPKCLFAPSSYRLFVERYTRGFASVYTP